MTRADFLAILDAHGAPEHVKRHCMKVGEVAENLAAALIKAGMGRLDMDVVRAAGYLHDIARAGKDHDLVGAGIVGALGGEYPADAATWAAAADIVARHMKLGFPQRVEDISEAEVVSLADRMVKEDAFVGYEARMEELLRRYANIREVADRVHGNMGLALGLIAQIETLTGKTIREIAMGGCIDIDPLLRRVERPGRYIGGEINAAAKVWADAGLRFCFAFPDLYEIGMSYTGFQIIYGLLNNRPDSLCERAFAPAADMADGLSAAGLPLFTLESRRPVNTFDIVGFTLQYELCCTNVCRMLDQARIPLYAKDRGESDPFILGGGPCGANPEPMADFFDLFCIGDGEGVLEQLADLYISWNHKRKAGLAIREGFLREASVIRGVYVPSFYAPVYTVSADPITGCETEQEVFSHFEKLWDGAPDQINRAAAANLDEAFFPVRPVVAHIESVHDRAVVEIMRGCYRSCRFCQASYACEGVRRRSPERIKELLREQLAHTGYDEVTLLSLSTGDYPGVEQLITDIMDELAARDVALSLPSLRLDSLKENTLKRIGEYKHSSLTFAPEAGTQRLRDVIDKRITEEDIMRALEIALPLGFTKFKFYFMIGLPTETMADLDGIAELARAAVTKAKQLGRERGEQYNFHLSVSVSNFVPKPGTPIERARGGGEAELMEKIMYLKDAIRRVKGTSFKYHDTRMSRVEMLLAKGDRRAAAVIAQAARMGAGFDSWREHFRYGVWLKAFEDAGLPAEDLYARADGPLPWELIGPGKAYGSGAAAGAESGGGA
ncbi:MAG: TIGR03960 family B12-binding radical SAM protein [Clostridiales Family XIII bacterium]|jgi:radical SAM family uncharacterized protein|nr:TIGR03960 family B12-binding radical SAM protein [Clostridiales Family XIII bacterium]